MAFAPYEVVPYSFHALALHIERVTGTPLYKVQQKRQMRYLDVYLREWIPKDADPLEPCIIKMVYENDYIDHHYVEDFSRYFVRCFRKYERNCSRIHLLKVDKLDPLEFRSFVRDKDHPLAASLQDGYLGNIVVRPIPDTFFAKTCLKQYPCLADSTDSRYKKILRKNYKSSLFGHAFYVDSIAFQEQDKVLSACATSALWSFFHAHPCISKRAIPSAIEITTSAVTSSAEEALFPNSGLSFGMMSKCIRENNLEPSVIDLKPKENSTHNAAYFHQHLCDHIYAYCSAGFPLILGIEVFSSEGQEKPESIGRHAVTILGYSIGKERAGALQPGELPMRSSRIDKIYIHDDRFGPFARLEFIDEHWQIRVTEKSNEETDEPELYKAIGALTGVYHKIRIPFGSIKRICTSMHNRLIEITEEALGGKEGGDDALVFLSTFEWVIKIEEVSIFKAGILNSDLDGAEKENLLTRSLPRYMWVAEVYSEDDMVGKFLFDATDIPQGNHLLEIVSFDEGFRELIQLLANYFESNYHSMRSENSRGVGDDPVWGIYQYFIRRESFEQTLDGKYGKLKGPQYIKSKETQGGALVRRINEKKLIDRPIDWQLETEKKYIWVITEFGELILDEEPVGVDMGHPTLINGALGRIAGELYFKAGKWIANTKSGRYSYSYDPLELQQFLKNAISNKINPFLRIEAFDEQSAG